MIINVLPEEPKKNSKFKQFLFNFTRPIAKLLQENNFEYLHKTKLKQEQIALWNKEDFIAEAYKYYSDIHLAKYGYITIKDAIHIMDKSKLLFEEKKKNGGFDELNVMK